MKKCPTCNRTFTDDALSFCLEDGSALLSVEAGTAPPSYDPGATMQYIPGRETNPPPPPVYSPLPMPGQQVQPQSWTPLPPGGGMPGQAPPKKSKALFWILGIIGLVVVVGIVGVVLAIVLVGSSDSNTNNGNGNNSNVNANRNANNDNNNSNANANSNSNANSTPSKVSIAQDDFTSVRWWVGSNVYGKAEYVTGEYQLTGGSATGYVAVYGQKTYLSDGATTRITARNVTGAPTPKGFGLAVFGELKGGQLDDYSFLIRTDESPAFRVVSHASGEETVLVDWTTASQVRTGSSPNQLEVRASSTQLGFYINGQLATNIDYSGRNATGIAGAYTSGLSTIAFDDLEIFK